MSNFGQAALSVVGAVVGFVYGGGPVGAVYGFQLGMLAGQQLFPTELQPIIGPKITDLTQTSAVLGVPLPYIYGTFAVPGFVVYLGCPEEVAQTEHLGGKGGGTEQKQTTFSYFQTIALGLAEGAIDGMLRVWENGELKYDVREQQEDETDDAYATRIEISSEYAAFFTLYLGDEDQEADPTIETELGVGNVPGYRGLAYIVYPNRQLMDEQARRHPQFRFEIYKAVSTGREIVYPTNIGTAVDWAVDRIGVDWARNRYITHDRTSGANGYLRGYSILDNTEYAQVDIGLALPTPILVDLNFAINPYTGDLYFAYFSGGNEVTIARVDPETLMYTAAGTFSGIVPAQQHSWERVCFVRQFGVTETRDYIFGQTSVSDDFFLINADTINTALTQSQSQTDVLVCTGARSGANSFAWALAYTDLISGTSPDMDLYRLKVSEEFILTDYVGTYEIDLRTTIAPSDIEPTWDRWESVKALMYDETDGCLMFWANGAPSAAGASFESRLIKYDPEAEAIVWQSVVDVMQMPTEDVASNQSRLRAGRLAVWDSPATFHVVDTATGEIEEVFDFSELATNLVGEQVFDGSLYATITFQASDLGPVVIFFDRRRPGVVSLAEIVSDVWERVGGDVADIDVVDLETRYVLGYATTNASGRGAIEPLRPLGPFDGVESEGILKFPVRGKAIVHSFDESELGVFEGDKPQTPAMIVRERQDVELPRRMRVKYIATSRDYENGEQLSPTRFTSATVQEIDVDIPVAITDDMAAQTAEILWMEAWISRWSYETSVDIEHLALDPSDAVELPFDGRLRRTRIVTIDDGAGGLLRRLGLMRDDDGTYTSNATADTPLRQTTAIAAYSLTALILLDVPPLRDEDDNAGIYGAMYALQPERQWNGATVQRSTDEGATFAGIATGTAQATVGQLASDLGAGDPLVFDNENTIVVNMVTDGGEFASTTEDDVLTNQSNALAIGAHGRWEIVQFVTATQLSATQWELSGLLRGRRGTDHNTGTGVLGDFVVLLSTGVIRLLSQLADVDTEQVYRAVSIGMAFSTASSQEFTPTGESLMPFSPVNVEGERDGSNNLTLVWTRRGRFGQEMPDGADIALSEESEEYVVEIVDDLNSPSTVLRTITGITSATTTYTAAQQVTDGLTPGDPVNGLVYQISASIGRGHAREFTV